LEDRHVDYIGRQVAAVAETCRCKGEQIHAG
jgi:hypothetical protein